MASVIANLAMQQDCPTTLVICNHPCHCDALVIATLVIATFTDHCVSFCPCSLRRTCHCDLSLRLPFEHCVSICPCDSHAISVTRSVLPTPVIANLTLIQSLRLV
eukprot:16439839-Heterocapsa_arctica.AAC.1